MVGQFIRKIGVLGSEDKVGKGERRDGIWVGSRGLAERWTIAGSNVDEDIK